MLRRSSSTDSPSLKGMISAGRPSFAASAVPTSTSTPFPSSEKGAGSVKPAPRSGPLWPAPGLSAAGAAAEARASAAARTLFLIDGVEPGADRPHPFLAHDAFELRHQRPAVAEDAAAHRGQEHLVALCVPGEEPQVGGEAARDSLQAVATGALLRVGGFADPDGDLVGAIRVALPPGIAERIESGRVDGLGGHV